MAKLPDDFIREILSDQSVRNSLKRHFAKNPGDLTSFLAINEKSRSVSDEPLDATACKEDLVLKEISDGWPSKWGKIPSWMDGLDYKKASRRIGLTPLLVAKAAFLYIEKHAEEKEILAALNSSCCMSTIRNALRDIGVAPGRIKPEADRIVAGQDRFISSVVDIPRPREVTRPPGGKWTSTFYKIPLIAPPALIFESAFNEPIPKGAKAGDHIVHRGQWYTCMPGHPRAKLGHKRPFVLTKVLLIERFYQSPICATGEVRRIEYITPDVTLTSRHCGDCRVSNLLVPSASSLTSSLRKQGWDPSMLWPREDRNGIAYAKFKDHPRSSDSLVPLHEYVMELEIGRVLRPNESVSFIDGNTSNIQISNLRLEIVGGAAKTQRTYIPAPSSASKRDNKIKKSETAKKKKKKKKKEDTQVIKELAPKAMPEKEKEVIRPPSSATAIRPKMSKALRCGSPLDIFFYVQNDLLLIEYMAQRLLALAESAARGSSANNRFKQMSKEDQKKILFWSYWLEQQRSIDTITKISGVQGRDIYRMVGPVQAMWYCPSCGEHCMKEIKTRGYFFSFARRGSTGTRHDHLCFDCRRKNPKDLIEGNSKDEDESTRMARVIEQREKDIAKKQKSRPKVKDRPDDIVVERVFKKSNFIFYTDGDSNTIRNPSLSLIKRKISLLGNGESAVIESEDDGYVFMEVRLVDGNDEFIIEYTEGQDSVLHRLKPSSLATLACASRCMFLFSTGDNFTSGLEWEQVKK